MRSPRGGRFLPRSWRGAASSRGTTRRAGDGPARGAGLRRDGLARGCGRLAGALGRLRQAGQKRGCSPRRIKILFPIKFFQEIFKCHISNIILSTKMTSFENVPKMKVAQNFILYNFDFNTNVQFSIDFEL